MQLSTITLLFLPLVMSSTNCSASIPVFLQDPLPLPVLDLLPDDHTLLDEPKYDSAVHLALGNPEHVTTLPRFDKTAYRPTNDTQQWRWKSDDGSNGSSFGYTSKIRLLSDEGLRVLRTIIDQERAAGWAKPAWRIPLCMRGLVHRSAFVRDLTQCPVLASHLSHITGQALNPFGHSMNAGHINFGLAGQGGADKWHFDSHPFVLVIVLSDMSDTTGGALQLLKKPRKEGLLLVKDRPPLPGDMDLVHLDAGEGVLVKGADIVHTVSPVIGGDRISFTNAYEPANAFESDCNNLDTWLHFDHDIAAYEFMRTKAYRASNKLKFFALNSEQHASRFDQAALARMLESVGTELKNAAALLRGDATDAVGFADEGNEPGR
jgi:hypothetical protein